MNVARPQIDLLIATQQVPLPFYPLGFLRCRFLEAKRSALFATSVMHFCVCSVSPEVACVRESEKYSNGTSARFLLTIPEEEDGADTARHGAHTIEAPRRLLPNREVHSALQTAGQLGL
jgi:hypothetical protein